MNNRKLAIKISKHPLIELLKKDTTIPNSIVARLIVEETANVSQQETNPENTKNLTPKQETELYQYGIEKAKEYKKLVAFVTPEGSSDEEKKEYAQMAKEDILDSINKYIEEKYPDNKEAALEIVTDSFNKNSGDSEAATDFKGLIIKGISDGISDQINDRFIDPIIDKVSKFALGATVVAGGATGGIGALVGGVLRFAAIEGGGAALRLAVEAGVQKIVSEILDSFSLVDNINDKLGDILGNIEERVVQAKTNQQRIDIIKKNGFQIFKNVLVAGVEGKFGDNIKSSFVKTLGLKPKIAGIEIPIGAYFTEMVFGKTLAQQIDKSYDKIKQQEARGEQAKKIKDNSIANLKKLKPLLDEMEDIYTIVSDEYSDSDIKQIPSLLSEGPSRNLKDAITAYNNKQFQKTIENLIQGLEKSAKYIKDQKNTADNIIVAYKNQMKVFVQLYELGLKLQKELEQGAQEADKKIKAIKQDAKTFADQASTKPTAQPTSEPETSEPASEPESQEADEETGTKKASTEIKGKPVAINPDKTKEFIDNANKLINEFYNQKYRKDQAKIVEDVINSMKEFTEPKDMAVAFARPPTDESEQESTGTLEEQKEVKVDKDEARNIRIGLRSFLSRVNKTKKYLTEFEEVAKSGSVLSDTYKKRFMDNLKEIQAAIYRLALVLNKMLNIKEELNEKKDSKVIQKWKEVQKVYDLSIKSVSSIKELLDTGTPPKELDSVLTNDAYSALIDLAGHFPSVAPFGSTGDGKAEFKAYQVKFNNAISQVKNDLQNVFTLIKTGGAGEEALQNARGGLKDFGDHIASIFGVPSRFKDAKVQPGDDEEPAVQEDPEKEPEKEENFLVKLGTIMTTSIRRFLGDKISSGSEKEEIEIEIKKDPNLDKKTKKVLNDVVKQYGLTKLQEKAKMTSGEMQLYIQLLIKLEEKNAIKLEESNFLKDRIEKAIETFDKPEQEKLRQIIKKEGVFEHLSELSNEPIIVKKDTTKLKLPYNKPIVIDKDNIKLKFPPPPAEVVKKARRRKKAQALISRLQNTIEDSVGVATVDAKENVKNVVDSIKIDLGLDQQEIQTMTNYLDDIRKEVENSKELDKFKFTKDEERVLRNLKIYLRYSDLQEAQIDLPDYLQKKVNDFAADSTDEDENILNVALTKANKFNPKLKREFLIYLGVKMSPKTTKTKNKKDSAEVEFVPEVPLSERIEKLIKPIIREMLNKGK